MRIMTYVDIGANLGIYFPQVTYIFSQILLQNNFSWLLVTILFLFTFKSIFVVKLHFREVSFHNFCNSLVTL